jgi:hypothetical protein
MFKHMISRWFRPERALGTRFLNETFEFVAWRYQVCSDQVKLFVIQSLALVALDVGIVLLALRTQQLAKLFARRGVVGVPSGMIMTGGVAVVLLSLVCIWYNVRQIMSLRREIKQLHIQAGGAAE